VAVESQAKKAMVNLTFRAGLSPVFLFYGILWLFSPFFDGLLCVKRLFFKPYQVKI
jgi:hypothetical protein